MSKITKIILFIFLIGMIVSIILLKMKSQTKVTVFELEQPKIENIINNRLISGLLLSAKEVSVKSQISGILDELFVEVGDRVEIGDSIVRIKLIADPKTVEISEKNVKTASINFENEYKTYLRNKQLYEKGVIAKIEYESSIQSYKLALADLNSAKKQLQIVKNGYAKEVLEVTNIVKSTAAGTILELPLKEGSSIIERNNFNEGSTIAVIADLDSLIFRGRVSESDIIFLYEGLEFVLTINALNNLKTTAVLYRIFPKGIEQNGVMKFDIEAKVNIPLSEFMIRSGYSAIADIIIEKKDSVLTINEKNLQFNNDTVFVEVLKDDINFEKKNVKTGLSDGLRIEILDGITINDKIKIID